MKNITLALLLAALPIALTTVTAAPATPAAPAAVYDFGDHSSAALTLKAWKALEAKDHAAVSAYTGKCREMYFGQAVAQQTALKAPVPTANPQEVHAQWALNDVGTCLFILGQSLEQQGQLKDAMTAYKLLSEKLPFSQCWDTKGWFWSPADAAKGRIKAVEFEAAQK